MSEPREYTREECRKMFLDEIKGSVRYWLNEEVSGTQEKLEGLAFSILVMLDGGTDLPGMRMIPRSWPERDENWWPDDIDIGGSLHEEFHR